MCREHGIHAECAVAGSRVVTVRIGNLTLRDSYALAPLPLAKFAAFGGGAGKGDFDHSQSHPDMSQDLWRDLETYLERDCRVLADSLRGFFATAHELEIELRPTIGACAFATAQRELGLSKEPLPPVIYHATRQAYYGGRCQVLRTEAPSGHRYDINSAYPFALATQSVPLGDPEYYSGADARRAYRYGAEGAFTAAVHVPECHIPSLPVRTPNRIAYPLGAFTGCWTGRELRYAESLGVQVEVLSAWAYAESHVLFGEFMEHFFSYRASVGKNTPQGLGIKLLINSLTGKFAQSPETETVHVAPDDDRVRVCPGGDCEESGACAADRPATRSGRPTQCCDHRCTGHCRRWNLLGRGVWSEPVYRIAPNARPIWAAYLTAATRVQLHQMLTADGRGGTTAVYCDTDSCYATHPRAHGTPDVLGDWSYDGQFRDFRALAPKAYAYDSPDGDPKQACKGVPALNRARFEQYAKGNAVPVRVGVSGLKTAARTGRLFARAEVARANRADGSWFGDRVKCKNSPLTRPQTLRTILAHEGKR
jgi:hypothetical protein